MPEQAGRIPLDDERSVAGANIVLAQNPRQPGRTRVVPDLSLGSGYGADPARAGPHGPAERVTMIGEAPPI